MKRILEDYCDDEKEVTISCICSGMYLQKQEESTTNIICLVMNVVNGRSTLTNDIFSLILDENSMLLLSPLIIYTIVIKPILDINKDCYNYYNCYKLILIQNEYKSRLYKKDNITFIDNKQLKLIIQHTYYIYGIVYKYNLNKDLIEKSQLKLLNNLNIKDFPLIHNNYDGHSILIETLIVLLNITTNKYSSVKNNKKKQRLDEEIEDEKELKFNESKQILTKLSSKERWTQIYQEAPEIEKIFEYQLMLKKYENIDDIIKEIRKFKEDGLSIFYYRIYSFSLENKLNNLFYNNSYFKEYGGLSYFNDNQLLNLYNMLIKSINFYHLNGKRKLKKIENINNNNKEHILFIKGINILPFIIDITRNYFYNDKNTCIDNTINIENDDWFIDYIISIFIEEIKRYSESNMMKKYMTVNILKYNDFLYLINKIFSKSFTINDNINECCIINEFKSDEVFIKKFYLNSFIEKLFNKLRNEETYSNNFKINKLFLLDNNPSLYTELLCYFNPNDENYLLEMANFNINKNKFILESSFIFTNLNDYKPLFHKDLKHINYICSSKEEIMKNKDLKYLETTINENYNNFSLIYQNSNYSYKRSLNFMENLKLNREIKLKKQIDKDKQELLNLYDEELFDPDEEEEENDEFKFINERKKEEEDSLITSFNNIDSINKNKMKLIIIIDCHLLDINKWIKLFKWILTQYKFNNFLNIILLGCPFLNTRKSYGNPFQDTMIQISPIQLRLILFNKTNIQINKEDQEDINLNQKFILKDSYIKLYNSDVFK